SSGLILNPADTFAGRDVSLSASSLAFAPQLVDAGIPPERAAARDQAAAQAQTLTISNTGSAALKIASLVSSNPSFIVLGSVPAVLAPGAQFNVGVEFLPSSAASSALSGTLTLTDNAGTGTQTISLSGAAVTLDDGPAHHSLVHSLTISYASLVTVD